MATPDDVPGPSENSDSNLLAEVNSYVLVVKDEEMDQEDSDSKNRVKYEIFFNFPKPKPTSNVKCVAKCKICLNSYKYALNSKGNLLKHLQTQEWLKQSIPSNQYTFKLNKDASFTVKPKAPFKNQDKIMSFIVNDLCGQGG